MAALLTKFNVGLVKNSPGVEEEKAVDLIFNDLMALKETFLASIAGEQINVDELFDAKVKEIKGLLEPFGPFLEAPSLRHTESTGKCSIYSEAEFSADDFEGLFVQSLIEFRRQRAHSGQY